MSMRSKQATALEVLTVESSRVLMTEAARNCTDRRIAASNREMNFILRNVCGVQVRTLLMKRHAHNLQEHFDIRSACDKAASALRVKHDVIRPD
jgi:hypothetical protein